MQNLVQLKEGTGSGGETPLDKVSTAAGTGDAVRR